MDPLSAVLKALRFRSVIFCRLTGGTPWGLSIPDIGGASFHFVLEGACHLSRGSLEVELRAGDLLLLKRGAPQILKSARAEKVEALSAVLQQMDQRRSIIAELGPPPVSAVLVCGGFFYDRQLWDPLLDFLPDTLHLRAGDHQHTLLEALLKAV